MARKIMGLIVLAWTVVSATACRTAAPDPGPLPTADFVLNFCNFPQAWSVSRGRGVVVGVVLDEGKGSETLLKRLGQTAPLAEVRRYSSRDFLENPSLLSQGVRVLLIREPIADDHLAAGLRSIRFLVQNGVCPVLPAYFGPMRKDRDYSNWRNFIKNAADAGAVIVGTHGRFYQLGNLEFWKTIPVDVYALHTGIDGETPFHPDAFIEEDLAVPAYQAAGTAALLIEREPSITPASIKDRLRRQGLQVLWAVLDIQWRKGKSWITNRGFLSANALEDYLKQNADVSARAISQMTGSCLDAALILGLPAMADGEWCRRALRLHEARRRASGKGVTVAILDHSFVADDWSLKGRLANPGSIIPGVPSLASKPSHGTWMARQLVRIAPGVKIMPVVIMGDKSPGAEEYIQGIDYAIAHGADIISLSHAAVAPDKTTALDAAAARAAEAGATFVFIHYRGTRNDVIHPGPIEFAPYHEGEDCVHVIGTNFSDEFPLTWGVSQTAPIVAGVIALMKEARPGLKPAEIRKILLDSSTEVGGFKLLDAAKAVGAPRDSGHR